MEGANQQSGRKVVDEARASGPRDERVGRHKWARARSSGSRDFLRTCLSSGPLASRLASWPLLRPLACTPLTPPPPPPPPSSSSSASSSSSSSLSRRSGRLCLPARRPRARLGPPGARIRACGAGLSGALRGLAERVVRALMRQLGLAEKLARARRKSVEFRCWPRARSPSARLRPRCRQGDLALWLQSGQARARSQAHTHTHTHTLSPTLPSSPNQASARVGAPSGGHLLDGRLAFAHTTRRMQPAAWPLCASRRRRRHRKPTRARRSRRAKSTGQPHDRPLI